MTVNQLIEILAAAKEAGHGELSVIASKDGFSTTPVLRACLAEDHGDVIREEHDLPEEGDEEFEADCLAIVYGWEEK